MRARLISRKLGSIATCVASSAIGRLFRKAPPSFKSPVNVLVFKLDNAGDIVISSLLMPAVAHSLGNASIYYVVKSGLGGVLSHVDCVTGVIEVPSGLGHCSRVGADERRDYAASKKIIRSAITELRPRLIIDLRPTQLGNYAALMGRLHGCVHRVSIERYRLRELFGEGKAMKWKRHEAETFTSALIDSGVLRCDGNYRSSLRFWSRPKDAGSMDGRRYILIQPGAVWEYKKWPERNYALLLDSLASYYPDFLFVLAGSLDEAGACSRVAAMAGSEARERVVNLAGKTTTTELAGLVGNSEMVIANDSGIAHMSGAFGVRTVVFFGPSSPERFMPLSQRQGSVKVFHRKLACNPCDQHECSEGPASYCLTRVSPDEVAEYIKSTMSVKKTPVTVSRHLLHDRRA